MPYSSDSSYLKIESFQLELEKEIKYSLNQYTTEYGDIIFDESKGGDIKNTFLLRLLFDKRGDITLYINNDTKQLQHVSFVLLKGLEMIEDVSVNFQPNVFSIPCLARPKNVDSSGELGKLEIYDIQCNGKMLYDGNNTLIFEFGERVLTGTFSQELGYFLNSSFELSGIVLKNEKLVNSLLKKIESYEL